MNDNDELILLETLDEVLAQTGDRKSKTYDDIVRGVFPKPVKIGRASRWPHHETQAVVRARVSGASEDEQRLLVRSLHEQRKRLMPRLEPVGVTV